MIEININIKGVGETDNSNYNRILVFLYIYAAAQVSQRLATCGNIGQSAAALTSGFRWKIGVFCGLFGLVEFYG